MEILFQWDQQLFFLINEGLSHPWLDAIMPWWRDKYTWIPMYVLLLALAFWRYRQNIGFFLLAVVLTVTLADTLSSKVVKPSVERLRPCRNPEIKEQVQVRISCGPGYSFTSSHATNHFAIACLLYLTMGRFFPKGRWLLLIWAATISIGQVYVGVHYPLDIIGGALLGSSIGIGIALLNNRFFPLRATRKT